MRQVDVDGDGVGRDRLVWVGSQRQFRQLLISDTELDGCDVFTHGNKLHADWKGRSLPPGGRLLVWPGTDFLRQRVGIVLDVLDHIYISVSDVPRSAAFYAATLKPLGWKEVGSYDSSTGPKEVPDLFGLADGSYGSGVAVGSSIWLRQRQPGETGLYVGFVADDDAEVEAAYAAGIEAGGSSEGEPAIRTYFGPGYYAANIADFDGNHLEIVHKSFNPRSRQPPA